MIRKRLYPGIYFLMPNQFVWRKTYIAMIRQFLKIAKEKSDFGMKYYVHFQREGVLRPAHDKVTELVTRFVHK